MKKTPELMLVGRLPPPYGGVTVHLDRLRYYLEERRYPFVFCDLGGSAGPGPGVIPCAGVLLLIWNLLSRPCEMVHCHASNPWLFLLVDTVAGRMMRRKVIHTLHGEGMLLLCEAGPFPLRWLLRRAFKRAARIIAINAGCAERAARFAASPEAVELMPAYLPPTPAETTPEKPYSEELESFFRQHARCFAAQGVFRAPFRGVPLYRFDLLGKALAKIRERDTEAGLCLLVTQTLNPQEREETFALRRELGLEKHWLILEDFGAAVPVYKRCVAFIRPTMTDGDSLSLRECLDMGVPVVASDAVPRPKGCILFPCGDLDALESSLQAVLDNYPECQSQARLAKPANCLDSLLTCYRTLAPGAAREEL